MKTQVDRVAQAFGSMVQLAKAARRHRTQVSRWNMPRERGGSGGLIPSSVMPDVLSAADLLGVTLTAQDLDPRPSA